MQSPPFPRYLVPPRPKYSRQHYVLKHPQLPFLPQCQRPSFTLIQNNRQKKVIQNKNAWDPLQVYEIFLDLRKINVADIPFQRKHFLGFELLRIQVKKYPQNVT